MRWANPRYSEGVSDRVRLALLAVAAGVSGASVLPGDDGIPDPDSCNKPTSGEVDSLEIGGADEETFSPLSDGEVVNLVVGSQGGQMLPVRYRFRGPDVPGCIEQRSELRFCPAYSTCDTPMLMADSSAMLHTYEESDGSRTTRALYLILYGSGPGAGAPMELSVTAGGLTEIRRFYYQQPPADAGVSDAAGAAAGH